MISRCYQIGYALVTVHDQDELNNIAGEAFWEEGFVNGYSYLAYMLIDDDVIIQLYFNLRSRELVMLCSHYTKINCIIIFCDVFFILFTLPRMTHYFNGLHRTSAEEPFRTMGCKDSWQGNSATGKKTITKPSL